jgi:hypothetical protein
MSKITPILSKDDINGGEDGVYAWIIGSNSIDPTNTLTMYCIQVYTINEIGTKHINMMNELCAGHDDFTIDKMYYAGEFIKKNNEIKYNFLSGSFMVDLIDAKNPPQYALTDVNAIFSEIFNGYTVVPDITLNTFITTNSDYVKITSDKLIAIMNTNVDAELYKFDLTIDADKTAYNQLNNGVRFHKIRVEQQYNKALKIANAVKQRIPDATYQDMLAKCEQDKDLEYNIHEQYKITTDHIMGGKKSMKKKSMKKKSMKKKSMKKKSMKKKSMKKK